MKIHFFYIIWVKTIFGTFCQGENIYIYKILSTLSMANVKLKKDVDSIRARNDLKYDVWL